MGGMSTRVQSIVLCFALFFVAVAASAQTAPYTRTEIVNATGNPTADGSALLSAIGSLSPTPSATNRWLIKLEPGTYDLGTNDLVMRQYVDIEGSGIDATIIKGNRDPFLNSSTPYVNGMVKGADNAEIRELTLHCKSISNGACMAMSNEATSPRITRVLVRADGPGDGSHWGIRNWQASPIIEDAEINITATSSYDNYGIVYGQSSKMLVYSTEIAVQNADNHNVGILSRENMGRSELFNSRVKAISGSHAYGLWFTSSSSFSNDLKIGDSNIIAAAGTLDTASIRGDGYGGGSFNVRDSRIYSTRDAINDSNATLKFFIINSELTGSNIMLQAFTARIGTTQLIGGGSILAASSKACAGVYDDTWTFYPSTCP